MTNLGWRGYWSEFDYGWFEDREMKAVENSSHSYYSWQSLWCGLTDRLTEKWWR